MAFVDTQDLLWTELAAIVQDEGLSVYDIERAQRGGLRVFITKNQSPETDGENNASTESGVTSGDCSRVCRRLMDFATVSGSKYGLSPEAEIEVSSPGVNRTLRLQTHFSEAQGKRIRVVYAASENQPAGAALGMLERVTDRLIIVASEPQGQSIEIPFIAVKRANVEHKF
ncbi:hypothetical protein JNK13_08880 [bacterium]|nr:hypothetical protein [bacterium]